MFAFLFVIFLPTQLGKHFFFDFSYINGIRTDYLAPTFYLIDIFSLILIALNARKVFAIFKNKKILLLLLVLTATSLFAFSPWLAIYQTLRIIELISLGAIFYKSNVLSLEKEVFAFAIMGFVELVLGMWQILKKSSIQGFFYFLGERYFSLSTPGIAKISVNGAESLRAYGTFSHPNSMAGFYLLVYFFVLNIGSRKVPVWLKSLSLLICSLLIFISFSKTALIVYLILNLIYVLKSNFGKSICRPCLLAKVAVIMITTLAFLTPRGDSLTLNKRLVLDMNALQIIVQKPVIGTGIGNYLIAQKQFASRFYDFLNQPVHNIPLLFFAENGLVAGSFLILIFLKQIKEMIYKKPYLVAVIFLTGLLDHYWLSLIQNFLLLSIIVW